MPTKDPKIEELSKKIKDNAKKRPESDTSIADLFPNGFGDPNGVFHRSWERFPRK